MKKEDWLIIAFVLVIAFAAVARYLTPEKQLDSSALDRCARAGMLVIHIDQQMNKPVDRTVCLDGHDVVKPLPQEK